jgi:hypothetical protein
MIHRKWLRCLYRPVQPSAHSATRPRPGSRKLFRECTERSVAELWTAERSIRRKRNFRSESYETLAAKMKETEPTTDRDMVPNNGNFFRTENLKKTQDMNDPVPVGTVCTCPLDQMCAPRGNAKTTYKLRKIKKHILYILESNTHPFYSFRGLKNQIRIRIECGLDSRFRAGFWKNDRAGVRAVRIIQ